MTPRKPQKAKRDPEALLQKFQNDACRLPATPEFARKLAKLMREQLVDSPPPTSVVLQALIEAHAKSKNDATRSPSYMIWELNRENKAEQIQADEFEDGSDVYGDYENSDEEDSESDDESEGGGVGGSLERESEDEGEVRFRDLIESKSNDDGSEGGGEECIEPEFDDDGSEGGVGLHQESEVEGRSDDGRDAGSEGVGRSGGNRGKGLEIQPKGVEGGKVELDVGLGAGNDDSDVDMGDDNSDRATSQTAFGVSTQSNELFQGSLGSGTTPGRPWAHDTIFHIFNRQAPR